MIGEHAVVLKIDIVHTARVCSMFAGVARWEERKVLGTPHLYVLGHLMSELLWRYHDMLIEYGQKGAYNTGQTKSCRSSKGAQTTRTLKSPCGEGNSRFQDIRGSEKLGRPQRAELPKQQTSPSGHPTQDP